MAHTFAANNLPIVLAPCILKGGTQKTVIRHITRGTGMYDDDR